MLETGAIAQREGSSVPESLGPVLRNGQWAKQSKHLLWTPAVGGSKKKNFFIKTLVKKFKKNYEGE